MGEAKVKKKEEAKGEGEDQGNGKEAEGLESLHPRKNEVIEDGEENGENEGTNEGKIGQQGGRGEPISTFNCGGSARDISEGHKQSG